MSLSAMLHVDRANGHFTHGHRSVTGGVLSSKRLGFEFLRPLVDDMTQADPSKRPTMDEVVERFNQVRSAFAPHVRR